MDENLTDNDERELITEKILQRLVYASIGELKWIYRRIGRDLYTSMSNGSIEADTTYIGTREKLEQLQAEKAAIDAELAGLQELKEEIDRKASQLQIELQNARNGYIALKKEKEEMNLAVTSLEEEKRQLVTEKEMTESEKQALARELERVGRLYEELTGKQAEQENLSELLSLYITLMEEVFSGKTHFKLLLIMHGNKEEWTREELVKTTGIAEIELRKALGELDRAGLIDYDEETTVSTLKKRITTLS